VQYVELAKIILSVLAFVMDIIRERKASEQNGEAVDVSAHVEQGVGLLQRIGKISKVKELQALDLTELKPFISEFISKIHALRALHKD
jgi:hypothetical protein